MKRTIAANVCVASLALSACGAPAPKAGPTDAVVGVFTSATDCAASGKADLKSCSTLIQQAVIAHQKTAKSYISLRQCEAAEGVDLCERADPTTFRRSLLAFQVTFAKQPVSAPLYIAKGKGVVGFSTFDKSKVILAVDEAVIFSPEAKLVALSNIPTK